MRRIAHAEVLAALGVDDLFGPVGRSLDLYSQGLASVAAVGLLDLGDGGDVHIKSAAMRDGPYFVVKVAASLAAHARPGPGPGPALSNGAVVVFDARSGDAVAFIEDRGHLTDLRTAAAGAIATDALARSGPVRLGIVGTGVQARLQALALAAIRPLAGVRIWGRHADAAEALAKGLRDAPSNLAAAVAPSLRALVEESDVIVTATASRAPLVEGAWLRPGQHITALGADDLSKTELDEACLRRADVLVVDSRDQNLTLGELGRLARAGRPVTVSAELGDVLAGRCPGRQDDAEVTIAKLTGVGVQDVAAASVLLERLGADPPGPAPR